LTLSALPPDVHRAELDTLDAVLALVEAEHRRDPDAYRACLHDEFVERGDGAIVALGADAAVAVARDRWGEFGARHVEVEDVSVTHPMAFVRFSLHEPHAEDATPVIVGVGYSVYEIEGRKMRTATHYVRRFDTPATAPVPVPVAVPAPRRLPLPLDVQPERRSRRRWKVGLVGIGSVLVQDAVLAAPVVAATARWGGLRAFTVFVSLYFVLALTLALLTLRLLARRDHGASSRIGDFLDRITASGAGRRALRAGSTLGFVLGAYILSSAPTVWALHELGVRRRLPTLAVLASAIWAAGFVGGYSGAATLIGI
jgi:hypothetical protein